jgi:hypothetical protein
MKYLKKITAFILFFSIINLHATTLTNQTYTDTFNGKLILKIETDQPICKIGKIIIRDKLGNVAIFSQTNSIQEEINQGILEELKKINEYNEYKKTKNEYKEVKKFLKKIFPEG